MSHNIDTSTGRAAIAFRGNRDNIWHKLGTQADPTWSIDDWAKNARLDWTADKVRAFAENFDAQHSEGTMLEAPDYRFLVRSDTKHVLGCVSNRYHPVQPRDILDWFKSYIDVDPRFQLDVAGSLKQGEIVWAAATFNGSMTVAGDAHVARLLMTTSFDSTQATINRATMTRVVCANTLSAALADKQKSLVSTRHSTRFDAAKVSHELSSIVQGFAAYKAMGEAMAARQIADEQISKLFKHCLDIPFETKKEDVSTRKLNQFDDLRRAYSQTVNETNGTHKGTAWAALNAVTRYVDHARSSRGGDDKDEARFVSAQFGSGAALKQKAVTYLDDICDGDLLRAVASKTADDADVSAMLKQAFKPTVIA